MPADFWFIEFLLKITSIFLIIFQSSGENPCIVTAAWHYSVQFLELNIKKTLAICPVEPDCFPFLIYSLLNEKLHKTNKWSRCMSGSALEDCQLINSTKVLLSNRKHFGAQILPSRITSANWKQINEQNAVTIEDTGKCSAAIIVPNRLSALHICT